MSINQNVILTEANYQGSLKGITDTEYLDQLVCGDKYYLSAEGEYYFIAAYDVRVSDQGVAGYVPNIGEYDMYGDYIGEGFDEITFTYEYTKRVFYLIKTNNGQLVYSEEIGTINTDFLSQGAFPTNLTGKIDQFKLSDNDFVQKNIKNNYNIQYNPKTYLTLAKDGFDSTKAPVKKCVKKLILTPYENLCDIILAETIKSYLL